MAKQKKAKQNFCQLLFELTTRSGLGKLLFELTNPVLKGSLKWRSKKRIYL